AGSERHVEAVDGASGPPALVGRAGEDDDPARRDVVDHHAGDRRLERPAGVSRRSVAPTPTSNWRAKLRDTRTPVPARTASSAAGASPAAKLKSPSRSGAKALASSESMLMRAPR